MVVRRIPPDPRAVQHWPDVPMRTRTRRRIAIAVPLILALAAAGYTARWVYTDREANEPVETVRAFLEAARSGEIEAALALTTHEPSTAKDLLVHEATSTDWEILDLDLRSWSPVAEYADVWATIKGPNDTELTHPLSVELLDGDWKVADPFATLTVEELPVPYLEVNGITLPIETASETDFALLPGVYQLYEHPPALFEYEAAPLLALGDRLVHADGAEAPYLVEAAFEGFTVIEDDEATLNERLTAYLDECLAGPDGPESFGCPFGLQEYGIDDPDSTLGDGNRWEIIEYPHAAAASVAWDTIYRPTDIGLLTRHEGRARVTAVEASTNEEVVLECPITTIGLYLVFDDTGDYRIGPNQDPNASTDPDRTAWDDGYRSRCEPA
ncbi:hypothetical protein [Glycomyces sp. YM15]|uniref:hypothetical protein n=1 Tax=Glycomyces sp. YM15 TaxID=2800446 RepID=UPI001966B7E2|nr:hypothetical protein [Glycomyces sp. YM15]